MSGQVRMHTSHTDIFPDKLDELSTLAPVATKDTNPKDVVGVRKAPMSTVSEAVMAEVGLAMLEGACKYGRHNYRYAGVRASVYFDALRRHMRSWWDEGEDIDAASGLNHVTKAIATLVVMRDAMICGKFTDDRPPSIPAGFFEALNGKAAQIIDSLATHNPRHYTIADTQRIEVKRQQGEA